jgi:hypothetical protein
VVTVSLLLAQIVGAALLAGAASSRASLQPQSWCPSLDFCNSRNSLLTCNAVQSYVFRGNGRTRPVRKLAGWFANLRTNPLISINVDAIVFAPSVSQKATQMKVEPKPAEYLSSSAPVRFPYVLAARGRNEVRIPNYIPAAAAGFDA